MIFQVISNLTILRFCDLSQRMAKEAACFGEKKKKGKQLSLTGLFLPKKAIVDRFTAA